MTILDGPDAPDLHVRLFQEMQSRLPVQPKPGHLMWFGQEKTIDAFKKTMVDEERLIYQFETLRGYGMF